MLFRGVGPIPSEAQGRQTVLRRGSSADSGSPRLEGGMGDRFWSSGEQVERLWPHRPKMSARSRAASSPCGAPLGPVRGPGRPWSPRGPSAVASCAGRDRRSSLAPSEPGPSRGRGRRAPDRQHAPHGASRGGKPLKGGPRPRAIGRDLGAGLNSKLHRIGEGRGRPLTFFLSPERMSDLRGARLLPAELPAFLPAGGRSSSTRSGAIWGRSPWRRRGGHRRWAGWSRCCPIRICRSGSRRDRRRAA